MHIAVIQYTPLYGEVDKNRINLLALCQQAVKEGANIIVLPEMVLSGYIWPQKDSIDYIAESSEGPSFNSFSKFCKTHKVFLAYGFAEKAGSQLFNSQNLIDDKGSLLKTYRKKHLFTVDEFWATPGDGDFFSIKTKWGKLGLGICMDLNYDDFVEFHKKNSDIILFATNWLEEDIDVHPYWIERLQGYKGIVAFANRSGIEFEIEFCGESGFYYNGEFSKSIPKGRNDLLLFSSDRNS